jgi:hypothetical protein
MGGPPASNLRSFSRRSSIVMANGRSLAATKPYVVTCLKTAADRRRRGQGVGERRGLVDVEE